MKWKIITLLSVMVIMASLVAIANIKPKINQIGLIPTPTTIPTPTPDPLAAYSILLMGYGGGLHEGGRLTDSMMVVRIDPRAEKITMISIPRDLWVEMVTGVGVVKSGKINSAFIEGSDTAKKAVESVVGFKIDYYAALNFNGFIKIIDILGGIDVKVTTTFDDPWYPLEKEVVDNCGISESDIAAMTATMSGEKLEQQFPCRYETLHFEKGIVHMDGTTALKFARSRHSKEDGGDFNRAARQRLVILAAKEKILSMGFLPKIVPTIKTLAANLKTDIDLTEINKLVSEANTISKYKIVPVALTNKNVLKEGISADRQYILEPINGSFDDVKKYIENPEIELLPRMDSNHN